MKQILTLLFLSALSLFAAEPWPGVAYAEVKAYAWPDDNETEAVILKDMALKPGAINEEGTKLTPDQVKRLRAAVTGKHPAPATVAGCFYPHNAFVFYDAGKKPVATVEVCFSCYGARTIPKATAEWPDLTALATIFDELKLPMGPYLDLKAYQKRSGK